MRLYRVDLDAPNASAPPPIIEQEQRVAVFDLLEENSFTLPGAPGGPYALRLGSVGGRLAFQLDCEDGTPAAVFSVSLGPLRQIVKDYNQICQSYYEAIKSQSPAGIELLDEARRNIHSEGGRTLMEQMDGKALIDDATSRRLFTLVCALSADR